MNYNAGGGRTKRKFDGRNPFEDANNALQLITKKIIPKRLMNKSPDLSQMISIKVSDKTTLFFKKGTPKGEINRRIKLYQGR